MTKEQFAETCVNYILDTECEDFDENPSKEHIFYYAMAYKFGENYAIRELKDSINYLVTGEGKI
jgi:hypothetical protein